jgi:hypothetical protein
MAVLSEEAGKILREAEDRGANEDTLLILRMLALVATGVKAVSVGVQQIVGKPQRRV